MRDSDGEQLIKLRNPPGDHEVLLSRDMNITVGTIWRLRLRRTFIDRLFLSISLFIDGSWREVWCLDIERLFEVRMCSGDLRLRAQFDSNETNLHRSGEGTGGTTRRCGHAAGVPAWGW